MVRITLRRRKPYRTYSNRSRLVKLPGSNYSTLIIKKNKFSRKAEKNLQRYNNNNKTKNHRKCIIKNSICKKSIMSFIKLEIASIKNAQNNNVIS